MSHQERQKYLHKKEKFKKIFSVIFVIFVIAVSIFLLWKLIQFVGGMVPRVGEEAVGLIKG